MKTQLLLLGMTLSFLLGTISAVGIEKGDLKINGDTPWVVAEADYQNIPVQKALRDAERDWYKVFGYPPVVFHDAPPAHWKGPVVVMGSAANTAELLNSHVPAGKEQYRLFAGQLRKGNPAVLAVGSDDRGTIYGIYTFCETILGIDPMYIFTDKRPVQRAEVTIAAGFDIVSTKPTFEYRGWFINDEELHDGMHRDPLGGNVISMEWMDKILETLLRCRGNMIIPESAPYPDATVYDLCQRRGVAVTHHHVTPLGLNVMNWPKNVPYSFITHKDILVDAWKKSVKAQAGKEIIWIIGFRGQSDGPFWNKDAAAPADDAGRANVIADAMQTQVDIIRAADPKAVIVAALWNEQGKFYNAGLLKIPAGVSKMFADDGRGFMRDDGGVHVEKDDGLYYHVMMMMNTQNRTTEGVPPARFYSELKRYVDKGATKYAIINVSGIRPAAMSVEAITDFLWDATPALAKTPEAAMKDYLDGWHAKQFGEALSAPLTALRLHYYNIPYMRTTMPIQGRWKGARGEHLIQYMASDLLRKYGAAIIKGDDLSAIDGFKTAFEQAMEPLAETTEFFPALWQETNRLAQEIPADRKDYYQAAFTYQVAVHMYSCRMLSIVTQALAGYLDDRNPQAFAQRIEPAITEVEKIITEAHRAEYGSWDTMFLHVRLMDFWRTRLQLKEIVAKIRKEPYTSNVRGYMRGSFWGDAQGYMKHGDGVFPYFYEHSGRGLEVLESGQIESSRAK